MADERTEKQKVQEITDKLEEGLKELFESEKYKTCIGNFYINGCDNQKYWKYEKMIEIKILKIWEKYIKIFSKFLFFRKNRLENNKKLAVWKIK